VCARAQDLCAQLSLLRPGAGFEAILELTFYDIPFKTEGCRWCRRCAWLIGGKRRPRDVYIKCRACRL